MMRCVPTKLQDAVLLEWAPHMDQRGCFMTAFTRPLDGMPPFEVQQINQSHSHKHVFRGMHFQRAPHAQAKIVQVLRGAILDFIFDLRPQSATQHQLDHIPMDATMSCALFVPAGFAHGFVALEADTRVQYLVDAPYAPQSEGGLHYRSMGIIEVLPAGVADRLVLSAKDEGLPDWGQV